MPGGMVGVISDWDYKTYAGWVVIYPATNIVTGAVMMEKITVSPEALQLQTEK
jgi:hypothetical protein